MTHKWSSWDHFWPFFGQLHENISQKRGSDSLNLNWIKSYDMKYNFFSFPVFCNFVKKNTENL